MELQVHVGRWLSSHLGERSRSLNDRPILDERAFVLCWLHHAIRDHENPALDVAITLGNALDRPVLVYQGLGGRHTFNSDRQHVFIMEGARDLQAGLEVRGIAHAFHLPRDPNAPSPLSGLLSRATAFVTEDFPAPPFPAWTTRWADAAPCAAVAVDSACLMPLRLPVKRFTRAFAFRKAAQPEWNARILEPWVDVSPAVAPLELDEAVLGFAPLDFRAAKLTDLAAACVIDHGTPPVRRVTGGSQAGYTRWGAFRSSALRRYDRCRNDAADMDAVSCLSPYLHHGHVSPFRIVREAHAVVGTGAEKFLDELLVWRELAFNFCAYTDPAELETLDALPAWARQTLADHAGDARQEEHSWETLARGATGDALWDAAQRSLLRNGELHNNLRMTWGKMVPTWTEDPAEALRLLIDLNHRFALDGSDPNSYGGLLWCLGQFDRPFEPEKPVLGSVRPRSTAVHARRLDPARFASAVDARAGAEPLRIAVIGGGISGLAAARTLQDQGCEVVVFDRGRVPGGRLSTRRARTEDGREVTFDHGAPWFTVTDRRFGRFVRAWIVDGVCDRWKARHVAWHEGVAKPITGSTLVVGVPGMHAVCRHLAAGLDVRSGTAIDRLDPRGDARWRVESDGRSDEADFDAVIVAAASRQAARLVDAHSTGVGAALATLVDRPAWVAMFVLDGDATDLPDVIQIDGDAIIEKLVRDDSKPGRARFDGRSRWIVHSRADWAEARLQVPPDEIRVELVREGLRGLGLFGNRRIDEHRVTFAAAHRWSFARAAAPSAEACITDDELRIAVAGDGLGGVGVEAAFLSGQAAAGRVLSWRAPRRAMGGAEAEAGLLFGGADE